MFEIIKERLGDNLENYAMLKSLLSSAITSTIL